MSPRRLVLGTRESRRRTLACVNGVDLTHPGSAARPSSSYRRTSGIDELQALLAAAGNNRALLATMALAGLRVSEACALRWRDVDLARGKLAVVDSKTDAGVRSVDVTPMLLDELKARKAAAADQEPTGLVFPTRAGTTRDRHNVRQRVLAGAVRDASAKLVE